jgi:hypothetical protein
VQTKGTKRVKKAKEAQKHTVRQHPEEFFRDNKKAPSRQSLSPRVCFEHSPSTEKMSASPASYNVTLATLRTTSPSRNKTRKQVRQQTEKEKRRARLLKKLEIVALRERGFAAHNVRFFKPTLSIISYLKLTLLKHSS